MDDLRPLSFYCGNAGRADTALCRSGGGENPGTCFLVHVFAGRYVSNESACATDAARKQQHGAWRGVHPHSVVARRAAGLRLSLGNTAYMTDVSMIRSRASLCSMVWRCWCCPALRHMPHPNHATLEQAVAWSQRIGARQTWFTHISPRLGHEETNRTLPGEHQARLRRVERAP